MPRKLIIPVGTRFGQASTLKELAPVTKNYPDRIKRLRRFLLMCDCGTEFEAFLRDLRRGDTKSCGCLFDKVRSTKTVFIEPGTRFGFLEFLEEVDERILPCGQKSRMAKCRCDCGNITIADFFGILKGTTQSCGCYGRKCSGDRFRKHGLRSSREHKSWAHAKDRCFNPNNPKHAQYAGRGITMCARYAESVANIVADIGMKPVDGLRYSLHRLDNDGNYSCGKCPQCIENGWELNIAWATDQTQANEKTNTLKLEWKGETRSLSAWARTLGIPYETLYYRLRIYLWPVERAFTEPVFVGKNQTHLRDEDSWCPALP